MILIYKLLLAHILGDFVLQPEKWVENKEKNKICSRSMYYHIIVHVILLLLIFGFNKEYILGYILIIGSHFAIDVVKVYLRNKNNQQLLFFLDQIAHITMIIIVVHIYAPFNIDYNFILGNDILLLAICVILVTFVSSVLIKMLVFHWAKDINDVGVSLENAGKYIGMLERLFVFLFVVLDQWQAIGFLLAAKSVFRFGDLSKAQDRKLTEYVLIGTLLSFAFAIVIGYSYEYFKEIIDIPTCP